MLNIDESHFLFADRWLGYTVFGCYLCVCALFAQQASAKRWYGHAINERKTHLNLFFFFAAMFGKSFNSCASWFGIREFGSSLCQQIVSIRFLRKDKHFELCIFCLITVIVSYSGFLLPINSTSIFSVNKVNRIVDCTLWLLFAQLRKITTRSISASRSKCKLKNLCHACSWALKRFRSIYQILFEFALARDIVLQANEHVFFSSTIFRFVTVKLSNPTKTI